MTLIARLAGSLVKSGRVTVVLPDGREEALGPGGTPNLRIRLADKAALTAMMRRPRLAIGELYMDGRLVIERGTMLELLELIVNSNPFEEAGKRGKTAMARGRVSSLKALFRRNPAKRARTNVAHHYDLDDRLYDLFLDPWRQYSCAYFTDPGNDLERAQRDKLAHIAAKLHLAPGQRVLDIGCGWGGLAIYLAKVAEVEVLGITLSTEQLAYAQAWAKREGVADQVTFALQDYRTQAGTFDRIVSIGMFEHVGLAHYDEFFETCRNLLAEDGVMLLHTIGKLGGAGAPDAFTDKWIFPGYHVPSLGQMQTSSEKHRMIVADVETLRLHYAHTLRHWLARCQAKRAEIVALYDERFFRMWEFYLAGATVMFEGGTGCNYQVQYVRNRRALPLTRDYMAAAEARYRKAGEALAAPASPVSAPAPAAA